MIRFILIGIILGLAAASIATLYKYAIKYFKGW
jgi:hypothetical protein